MTTSQTIPIVALDVATTAEALTQVAAFGESCRFYKVGSELFASAGPDVVRALLDGGNEVFLDLKFHDIPNTVRGAVRSAANLGVSLVTVHASGGAAMLRAAVEGTEGRCGILAVTVLTSLDDEALGAAWGRGALSIETEVLRLAELARDAGAHGIVCSGHEAQAVRERFDDSLAVLIPGIRFEDGDANDQARVMSPRRAAEAGARYIVLGRAVTAAEEPRAAIQRANAELALAGR